MYGLKPEVIDFFTPFFKCADGLLIFEYGNAGRESWDLGTYYIPSTAAIWTAAYEHSNLITDLYVSHSAAELLFFTSQRSYSLLKHPEQIAFASLGLLPSALQVNTLKAAFPFARWHLLFSPDLLGCVADASVAAWYKGRSVSFRANNEHLMFRYRGKRFALSARAFSLSRFEQTIGLRSGLRTHKPPRGLPSFIKLQITEP